MPFNDDNIGDRCFYERFAINEYGRETLTITTCYDECRFSITFTKRPGSISYKMYQNGFSECYWKGSWDWPMPERSISDQSEIDFRSIMETNRSLLDRQMARDDSPIYEEMWGRLENISHHMRTGLDLER